MRKNREGLILLENFLALLFVFALVDGAGVECLLDISLCKVLPPPPQALSMAVMLRAINSFVTVFIDSSL
jgi:hypothetical protein